MHDYVKDKVTSQLVLACNVHHVVGGPWQSDTGSREMWKDSRWNPHSAYPSFNSMWIMSFSVVDSVHLQAFQVIIDSFGELKKRSKSDINSRVGQKALYPGCDLFLSSVRLAAIHQEAKQDCLLHLLFVLHSRRVTFGKHGNKGS